MQTFILVFFWLYLSINLFTSLVVSYSIHFVFPSPSLCWIFFFFLGGVSFFKSVLLCSAFARVGRAGLIVCFALNVWAAVCRGGGVGGGDLRPGEELKPYAGVRRRLGRGRVPPPAAVVIIFTAVL